MNFAGKKHGWALPALGIAFIFCLCALSSAQSTAWFKITVSFSFPLVYFIHGYSVKLAESWQKYFRRELREAGILLVPAVVTVFLYYYLTFLFDRTMVKTTVNLRAAMQDAWQAVCYGSGDRIGDTAGIALVGILLVVFFCRLVLGLLHMIASSLAELLGRTQERRDSFVFIVETCLSFVVAIAANLLFRRGILLLTPGISKAMECLWFFAAGRIYRRYQEVLDRNMVCLPILAVTALIWGICQRQQVFLNTNATMVNWTPLSIVASVCACYCVVFLIRQLCRSLTMARFFRLFGEHMIVFCIASCLDLMMPLWQTSYWWLNDITRPLCVLGYTMAFCMVLDFLGLREEKTIRYFCREHWNMVTAVYLVSMAAGVFARAFWTTLIYQPTWMAAVSTPLRQVAIAGSLFAWGLSLPRIRRNWVIVFEYVLFIAGVISYFTGVGTALFPTILVILGASGKSWKKISWTFLLEILAMGVTTYFLSMNGYLPYEVKDGGLLGMHTFGFSVPNQAAWFFMMVCMLYLIVRSSRTVATIPYDIALLGFCLFFVYRYTDSITSIVSIALLLVLDVVYRILLLPANHFQTFGKVLHRVIQVAGLAIYPLMMFLSILLPVCYYRTGGDYPGKALLERFTDVSTFTSRIIYSFNALYNIPITAFGSNFATTTEEGQTYFVIDNAYVFLLLRYGVVLAALFLFAYIWLVQRCSRRHQDELILVLIVFAIYNFSENVIVLYAYNPMLLFFFAGIADARRRRERVMAPARGRRGKQKVPTRAIL